MQVRYWNKELETMPREKRERLQLERFRERMVYVVAKSPMYQKNMTLRALSRLISKPCPIFREFLLR